MKYLVRIAVVVGIVLFVVQMLAHRRSTTDAQRADNSGDNGAFDGLTILAGSELKDLEFLKPEMERAAGVKIRWSYTGTLDMVDAINVPSPTSDIVWAASGKYLSLAAPGKVKASEKIMLSPVVLGVKQSVARKLGWDRQNPTWAGVAAAVKAGKFHYGMTNPTASNSGFCAVVGVAAALSGKTDGLTPADIPTEQLRAFFSGQKLTAGSSGWLADAYVNDPAPLDGLINYESVILSMNAPGNSDRKLTEPLTPVYPTEGIITSDYPMMLVNDKQRPAYDKLVAFLKTDAVQTRLMTETHRRPVSPGVKLAPEFGSRLLVELPFPGTLDTLDALLLAYQDDLRRPGHAYFVLDTSGSMEGERIRGLREGLSVLVGDGGSRFSRINLREKVDLIPFAGDLKDDLRLDFGQGQAFRNAQARYSEFVDGLEADGGTAIYDALIEAYSRIAEDQKREPERYYSIVLMTDGRNTQGLDFDEFSRRRERLGDEKSVRVFPILFGDSDTEEMKALAGLTGGKTFDGRSESLAKVFKEIRGYQ